MYVPKAMKPHFLTALSGLCLLAAPVVALAQQGTDAAAVSLTQGYILGNGDVIEVSVLGRDDFQGRVQVQADGTVQLPFIGTVQAGGLSVTQLRDRVRAQLREGGYFNDPAVSVQVVTYASRYVIVLGEVTNPGILPVDRAYRVSEILARAGGTRATASEELRLRRLSGDELVLDLEEVATGGPEADPIVNPGDKLYIATAPTFYIYGQVNAPGTYSMRRGMSLRMALARGGGLTALGSEKRVRVFRRGSEIRNFASDDQIQEGDVVVVGERFF